MEMKMEKIEPIVATKRVLRIPEFCAAYGVGRTSAYAEIKAGLLKSIKIGRRTAIPVTEADAWLARKISNT
jgi:predicted DNA-binding transcriptional regulator AlpA